MTQDQLNDVAGQLESKAEAIMDGFYGPAEPGEDESWAGDLKHAAYLLREGRVDDLSDREWEEIECGSEYTREDFEEHPETDEHLASCPSCMMEHDKRLPNG